MSKRKQKTKRQSKPLLSPETKRGLLAILFFALSAITLLSVLNMAGESGKTINTVLTNLLGWARIVLPIIIAAGAALFLMPKEQGLGAPSFFGLIIFLIATVGVLETLKIFAPDMGFSGGYIGVFFSSLLVGSFGKWVALIIFIALILASILIIGNTSIEQLVGRIKFIGTIFKFIFKPFTALFNSSKNKSTEPRILDGGAPIDEKKEPSFVMKELPIFKKQQNGSGVQRPQQSPENSELSAALKSKASRKIDLPLDLLNGKISKPTAGDIKKNMEIIQQTLAHFGINVEMGDISVGPTVTQFTLKPQDGIKLTKITALSNDLALALAAHPIRIEAPIPGKSLVGIEVPNQAVATVGLREILDSSVFSSRKSQLMIALGKDVAGQPWFAELPRLPHLLVAGATGSGKTVCLNTIIVSLLYQNSPDDIKLILIDPKRVELPTYNGIPHLLTPVITDVPRTVNALKWTITEMERRFETLEKFGARDIASYNSRSEEKMPVIVIIVDELADLMAAAAAEIEASIIRIAQMARAVGIHLILATQRPSVDVITGLIKANVPARIAFSVASQTDSRTILDSSGAEKLLGRGDMLFTSPELSKPRRIQGAYISDDEINRVVGYLKKENEAPNYDISITEKQKSSTMFSSSSSSDDDPLIPEAKEVIIQAGKASASLLQRRLKVGYARAARLLDLLEAEGFIGPGDGAKPREVLAGGTRMMPSEFQESSITNSAVEEDDEDDEENQFPQWE